MLSLTSDVTNDALARLLAAATRALDVDRRAAKSCLQRVAVLLGIELSLGGNWTAERLRAHGGLAPWQAKQLKSYIDDKLDSSIRASELADVVQLSRSHFCRVFRQTFGESPLRFIMQRRICRAQELMLASRLPLSQVAIECGMSDHAHFCRAFRRIVGITPKAWRREFTVGPAPRIIRRGNPDSASTMNRARGPEIAARIRLPSNIFKKGT
jgi:AraC family transcriptional regulator